MIVAKRKKAFYFIIFLLPAFALYSFFFIYPFLQGVQISFTNWDGIASKTPISMPKADFETRILSKLSSESDRQYLLQIYTLDNAAGLYKRLSMTGLTRWKVERMFSAAGYEAEKYRFVGFQNYKDMFNVKRDERFLPRFYKGLLFKEYNPLPESLDAAQFENMLLTRVQGDESVFLQDQYTRADAKYVLNPALNQDQLAEQLESVPGLDKTGVTDLLDSLETIGIENKTEEIEGLIQKIGGIGALSAPVSQDFHAKVRQLFDVYKLKGVLARNMYDTKFTMGVIGFTGFFAFFNVVFANIAALLLALALDTKLRSKNILRSVFFLPNVLSLVIVAAIWRFIFLRVLPSLTGIDIWLSNPTLAPYLIVLVSVWQGCGYLMIINLAGLQNIPLDVIEAASIDGASGVKKFFNITLPLLMPALTVGVFYSLSNSLRSFDVIFALQGAASYSTNTAPIVLDIYFDAFNKNLAGYGTAKAIVLCLVIMVISGIQLFIMKRREVQL